MLCWSLLMNNKIIFKYKIVYWLSILASSALSVLFCYGSYFRVQSFILYESFSVFYIVESFIIFFVGILSLSAVFSFLFKTKYSIFLFNISLVLTFFLFIEASYFTDRENNDIIKGTILINVLVLILIFVINRFKYKEIKYENIEEIGKND